MLLEPPSRRRRQRRSLGLLAVVTVVAIVVVVVAGLRSDRRVLAGYLDFARQVVGSEVAGADAFVSTTRRLGEMERLTMLAGFDGALQTLTTASSDLEAADVPVVAAPLHAGLSLATDFWRDGVDAARRGVLLIVDVPDDPEGPALLEEAVISLRAGDAAYAKALDGLVGLESKTDVAIPDLPPVTYLPAGATAGVLIEQATRATGLALRRDVALGPIRFDPPALSQREDGTGIVPLTDSIAVQVSVINEGNGDESQISVRLVVTRLGVVAPFEEQAVVETLAPGASVAVDFTVPTEPGGEYTLSTSVDPAPGETTLDNNQVTERIIVNQEAS